MSLPLHFTVNSEYSLCRSGKYTRVCSDNIVLIPLLPLLKTQYVCE